MILVVFHVSHCVSHYSEYRLQFSHLLQRNESKMSHADVKCTLTNKLFVKTSHHCSLIVSNSRQTDYLWLRSVPVMLQMRPVIEMMLRVVMDVSVIADWQRADNFTSTQLTAVRKPVFADIMQSNLQFV